ncbi:MAG: DMT family transporter [Bacteroidales bacterium]
MEKIKSLPRAYLYAIVSIMLWSTVAVGFKIALHYMDYIKLLFIASLISFIILVSVLAWRKNIRTLFTYNPRQYLNSAMLGFLNPFGYYMILLKAYSILPAQLAQPLNYTWPIMLVLLSAPLLKQKLKAKSLLAIFISFLGVYLIASGNHIFDFKIEQPLGIFLATGSSVIWALFWILNVRDSRPEIIKLTLSFGFSIIYTFLAMIFMSDFSIPEIKGLLAATYIGFFEMGFTFILWLKALQMIDRSDKISNLVFISPFFSLIWIHLILKENIYESTVIGLVFIVLGIVIQQYKIKNPEKNG